MRWLVLLFLTMAVAACLDDQDGGPPGPGAERSVPATDLPVMVDPGSWRAIVVNQATRGWTLHADATFAAPAYQTATDDAYSCFAVANEDAWLDGIPTPLQAAGEVAGGIRAEPIDATLRIRYGETSGRFGLTVLTPPQEAAKLQPYFFAHHSSGSHLVSSLAIVNASDEVVPTDEGRMTCLASPGSFSGGSYVVTPQTIDGRDLSKAIEVERGLVLRWRSQFDSMRASITAPDGSTWPLQHDSATALDVTICRPDPGTWRIDLDHARTTPQTGWRLELLLLDTERPVAGCTPDLQASTVPALGAPGFRGVIDAAPSAPEASS